MKKQTSPWAAMGVLVLSAVSTAATRETVSNEDVPVYLNDVSKIVCRDRIPNHGYGAVPAILSVDTKALFDRTLRIDSAHAVYVSLPDTVTCADLKASLAATPQALTAHRLVEREVTDTLDQKRTISTLIGTITLTLPTTVEGKNVVLHGEQRWLEASAPAGTVNVGHQPLPLSTSYVTLTHPQSATDTVGLFCKPAYEGATETLLTLGELSGYTTLGGVLSNSDLLKLTTAKPAVCEELRASLLDVYAAEDPGNWGTLLRVNRTLELSHRYILDNQANQACQEIELETVTTSLRGEVLRAAAAFPLRTVPLKDCLPPQ